MKGLIISVFWGAFTLIVFYCVYRYFNGNDAITVSGIIDTGHQIADIVQPGINSLMDGITGKSQ